MVKRGIKKNKLLDRYIGIPLLFILGLFKRKHDLPKIVEDIGIIITPAIGDTILLQALLKDLKADKNIKITIFSPKNSIETVELIGYYDDIIEINYFNPLLILARIRHKKFDVFIDVNQWSRVSAIFSFLAKATFKLGFKTDDQYRHYVFDDCIYHLSTRHEVYNLKDLNIITTKTTALPCIDLPEAEPKNYVVLHIKSGGYLSYLKELPVEYWIKVIDFINKKGIEVFFTGSKYDHDEIDSLIKRLPPENKVKNFAGTLNLKQTSLLLKESALVISVNTGIMHLASALNCNLIALHGPTNALRWGPLNSNSIVIKSNYKSAPCLNLGFEYNCDDRTGECMKAIDVNDILDSIDSFIDLKEK